MTTSVLSLVAAPPRITSISRPTWASASCCDARKTWIGHRWYTRFDAMCSGTIPDHGQYSSTVKLASCSGDGFSGACEMWNHRFK
eukprot:CAMPEP_0182930984 /NCGR_PEP_ID=MMETSP0105_2-20130417/27060_1 /TAXON_ID=81532 ORGANISM="Acanthoeca-like sp., Strain 10tr" /NCGR_SAMPLE_ID=MMETSP0105_2 /ASSEMBLY_ACC=CAM_ASM_000205 /LENGTH=84 /DNA_ID=CAMNT_0025069353 /DNA_START=73 /DNA_END=327 /DNA_ORIENTATION=-